MISVCELALFRESSYSYDEIKQALKKMKAEKKAESSNKISKVTTFDVIFVLIKNTNAIILYRLT